MREVEDTIKSGDRRIIHALETKYFFPMGRVPSRESKFFYKYVHTRECPRIRENHVPKRFRKHVPPREMRESKLLHSIRSNILAIHISLSNDSSFLREPVLISPIIYSLYGYFDGRFIRNIMKRAD